MLRMMACEDGQAALFVVGTPLAWLAVWLSLSGAACLI
jgi:hypothetical protein